MKQSRFLIALFFIVCLLSSCHEKTTPDSPEKLFGQYHKSVVLIRNQFYLQVDLNNGSKGYICMSPDGYPMRTTNEAEAKQNPLTAYGTGFFISKDGKIATNRHVAYPEMEASELAKVRSYLDQDNGKSSDQLKVYTDSIAEISSYIEEHANDLTPEQMEALDAKKSALNDAKSLLDAAYEMIYQNLDEEHVKSKVVSIKIAYDNTFVDKPDSYYSCTTLEKSDTKPVDLAIVQLNDKTTPSSVDKIFDFDEHNPNIKNGTSEKGDTFDINKQLPIDKKLYMIGFNYGESMAKTTNGIKVQFTQGSVSQESDEYKVLYSIPSLPGSSGSPVIDQWGNLVAINYAGVTNSQSFNYGILAKHLKNMLMNEVPESHHKAHVSKAETNNQEVRTQSSNVDFAAKIRDFITLESERNFEAIYQSFSPNMRRYWDLKNPSKAQLKNRYEHSWSLTTQAKNEVDRIVKVDAFTYDLYANYTFTNLKNEEKTLKTVVRYEFDSFGKIVETYGK